MLRALIGFAFTVVPQVALAGSIYLNGVNVDGVVNKRFDNAVVIIDAQGNVFITTPAYAPPATNQPVSPAAQGAPIGGTPSKRYFLVTEKAAPGMTQYDIDLFANSKWVRKFLDVEEHVVLELTPYLHAGPNQIHLVAHKAMDTARRSSSPQLYFRIVIGEGDENGRNVMITRKIVDYKRTALETKDFSDEFELAAQ